MKPLLPLLLLLSPCAHAFEPPPWLDPEAKGLFSEMVATRRDLHMNPELSNCEERTSGVVAQQLQTLGLEVKTHVGKWGVVALLRGGQPGPCVAVRADMDALPIEEAGSAPFKSLNTGVMHACGHDSHTTIALGMAKLLAAHRATLAGSVKFLFQPAEEGVPVTFNGSFGARAMVEEKALENPVPKAIFALHATPSTTARYSDEEPKDTAFPAGELGWKSGPISANSDRFAIVVHGKMAHGSAPQLGIDAIPIAAEIVTALQTIRSRRINTKDPLVITVGLINGGQRENILAEKCEMAGTVRTQSLSVQAKVIELIDQIPKGIATTHGATAEVTYRKGYPAVVNDAALTARSVPILRQIAGDRHVAEVPAGMGGEDFSFFSQVVPGFYFRLGTSKPGVPNPGGVHTPDFDLDENALLTGVRALTAVVLAELEAK